MKIEEISNVPAMEYDDCEEEYIIDFSDVEDVRESYIRSPIVNTFIKYEILVRRVLIDEINYRNVSMFEVLGFAYHQNGESYRVTIEWIQEARDWIEEEF